MPKCIQKAKHKYLEKCKIRNNLHLVYTLVLWGTFNVLKIILNSNMTVPYGSLAKMFIFTCIFVLKGHRTQSVVKQKCKAALINMFILEMLHALFVDQKTRFSCLDFLCVLEQKISRLESLCFWFQDIINIIALVEDTLLAIMFHTFLHTCLLIHLFPLVLGSNTLFSPHSVGSPSNLLLGRDEWLGRYCITLPFSCVSVRFWLAPLKHVWCCLQSNRKET